MSKQVRVSSVIILRWLHNNATEVFKNLSQLFKKYDKEKLGISRRKLHDTDLTQEHITPYVSIRKSPIE